MIIANLETQFTADTRGLERGAKRASSFLREFQASFGRQSSFGIAQSVLIGGGVLAGVTLAADKAGEFAQKMGEVLINAQATGSAIRDIDIALMESIRKIPVISSFFRLFSEAGRSAGAWIGRLVGADVEEGFFFDAEYMRRLREAEGARSIAALKDRNYSSEAEFVETLRQRYLELGLTAQQSRDRRIGNLIDDSLRTEAAEVASLIDAREDELALRKAMQAAEEAGTRSAYRFVEAIEAQTEALGLNKARQRELALERLHLSQEQTEYARSAMDALYLAKKAASGEEMLAALRKQVETFGLSAAQLRRYELASADATLTQRDMASAMLDELDALERAVAARERYTESLEAQRGLARDIVRESLSGYEDAERALTGIMVATPTTPARERLDPSVFASMARDQNRQVIAEWAAPQLAEIRAQKQLLQQILRAIENNEPVPDVVWELN